MRSTDFAVHTGDVVDGLTISDDQYFVPYALLEDAFFLALGNDYGRDVRPRRQRFPEPTSRLSTASLIPARARIISLTPPTPVFVLDTNAFGGAKFAPTGAGFQAVQVAEHFLKAADKPGSSLLHHPLYSTGAHPPTEELVKALEPLFLKYKVDLVLQGHDHDYERTLPIKDGLPDEAAGIIYVTLGGGGNQLYIQRRNEDCALRSSTLPI